MKRLRRALAAAGAHVLLYVSEAGPSGPEAGLVTPRFPPPFFFLRTGDFLDHSAFFFLVISLFWFSGMSGSKIYN